MSTPIAAGIVTYNPELKRLEENLDSICAQTVLVIVYDNGSDNAESVKHLLDGHPNCAFIPSDRNSGMAVALNALANEAIARGFSDVLLLDQDSVAPNGMAEQLFCCRGEDVGIVGPKIVDRNEASASEATGVIEVPRLITSGSLLNLRAYAEIGGYDERLFVDWVDFEFCNNMRVHGYRLLRDNDVQLLHEFGHEEYAGVMVHRGANGRLEAYPYYRSNHPDWRMRDRGRSLAITSLKYQGTELSGEDTAIYRKSLVKTALFEKHGLRKALEMARGWREGKRTYGGADA